MRTLKVISAIGASLLISACGSQENYDATIRDFLYDIDKAIAAVEKYKHIDSRAAGEKEGYKFAAERAISKAKYEGTLFSSVYAASICFKKPISTANTDKKCLDDLMLDEGGRANDEAFKKLKAARNIK